MWRDGELVRQEEHTLHINFYFKNETLLLLERAAFPTSSSTPAIAKSRRRATTISSSSWQGRPRFVAGRGSR
jgi:hypothetical protein